MAADPAAFAKSFVPDVPEVLHATRLLQPGQTERLAFTAPAETGDFPYVCTFPGHWRRMNGVLRVVKSLDDVPPEALVAAATPTGPVRAFVREELIPLEGRFLSQPFRELLPVLAERRQQVRRLGLWAPHLPREVGGAGLSLPAFALIVQGQGRAAASEGAFKYLVLPSVASALLLFGASIGYGLTGTLGLEAFAALSATGTVQAQAALLLVLSGLFLKAAVFPFHAWAPVAYAAARLPVTALMASVVKAAVVLAIVRVVGRAALATAAVAVITGIGLVSLVFGNLATLGQPRFKRLLDYS
jgi:hypothetical protein